MNAPEYVDLKQGAMVSVKLADVLDYGYPFDDGTFAGEAIARAKTPEKFRDMGKGPLEKPLATRPMKGQHETVMLEKQLDAAAIDHPLLPHLIGRWPETKTLSELMEARSELFRVRVRAPWRQRELVETSGADDRKRKNR